MTTAPKFIILKTVDSTNNYAMGMIHDGVAKHGDAWFTYEQTQGKGRRGKSWKAERGENVMFSIAVIPGNLTVYQQFHLSVAVSLGCIGVFKKYAGDKSSIKWPNDIFWNDRKAGGILIENVIKGNKWLWAVIGIGLNVNQTRFNLDAAFPPVSLRQITGKELPVLDLTAELYEAVITRFEQLQNKEFEIMLEEYNQYLFGLDKKVKLKKDNVVFETTITGISPNGKLTTTDTMEREFDFDEVEWLNQGGRQKV